MTEVDILNIVTDMPSAPWLLDDAFERARAMSFEIYHESQSAAEKNEHC